VPLFSKTDEEKAAKAEAKQAKQEAEAKARHAKQEAKVAEEFARSPQGRARAAFERGDQLFQCALDLQRTHANVSMLFGGQTYTGPTDDPNIVLNAIAQEGWELVSASVVFVETGSETRDKLLASGQNVATRGTTVGFYAFRRRAA
jgi:hypothetical protein